MHGLGRVLGSVPNKVSHRARCSVLIVATGDA
jgi:nucleotide-binding universal stress UspA family protein